MGQIIKVTYIHETAGEKLVANPEGVEESYISYERHPEFHCITKSYETPFSAYGTNGIDDGGRDWIKDVIEVYGPDAIIRVRVEMAEGTYSSFSTIFTGMMPAKVLVEVFDKDHTFQMTFTPEDFWNIFLSRYEIPVDIFSDLNLDGGVANVLSPISIGMPPQKLKLNTLLEQTKFWDFGNNFLVASPDFQRDLRNHDYENKEWYLSLDLDTETLSEIEVKGSPILGESRGVPDPMFKCKYAGTYLFNIELFLTAKVYQGTANPSGYKKQNLAYSCFGTGHIDDFPELDDPSKLEFYIKFNSPGIGYEGYGLKLLHEVYLSDNPDQNYAEDFFGVQFVPNGKDRYVKYYTSFYRDCIAGEEINIYGILVDGTPQLGAANNTVTAIVRQLIMLGGDNSNPEWPYNPQHGPLPCHIENAVSKVSIVADTIFPETLCPGLLMHDVGAAVVERITGKQNSFNSPYMGAPATMAKSYPTEGHIYNNFLIKGMHLRNYTIAEKKYFQSMKDFWEGANPIFCLYLKHAKVEGQDVIQIGPRKDIYDSSVVTIQLSNVKKIQKEYDDSGFPSSVDIGYKKWNSEDAQGIDDVQTKRTFASRLRNIGQKWTILSEFIAAGLTIEQARRTSRYKTTDYKYDNDTFIINVVNDGFNFRAATDEQFSNIQNVRNGDSRYNLYLSCYRNLLRNSAMIFNGLQSYIGSLLRFTGGEGNYDMISTTNSSSSVEDYGGLPLSESQDIAVTSDFLFLPIPYTIEHYLTTDQFKAFDANPEAAIEVSMGTTNYKKFFVKTAKYYTKTGLFSAVLLPKELLRIQSVPSTDGEYTPNTRIFSGEFENIFN